ncbi:MAG: serine hydrolase [Kordiimonadaceae bacterium]|nr:serine hydrolase [Kordiimonadaceae bacterium]MBO6567823.1 serine hydrolase [Kordiimonadaceae bacterium]MBO6964447.1 serine hydrolase [Kordiimonadaceae bacterium]
MTATRRFRQLFAILLLSGFSSITALNAQDQVSTAAEASATEADLPFREVSLLESAFIDTAPDERDGSTQVGVLDIDTDKVARIVQLAEDIGAGKYGRYDSLLVAHKDKLVFESYFRRGRINLAHPQASATKGHTSLILGRAMQLGYLTMADLDKPLIDFLGDLDRSKLVEGAEKITLHKALTMHGGLNVSSELREELERDANEFTSQQTSQLKGQGLVQTLLQESGPITDETQTYLYGNFNPMLVMTVIDAVVPGSAEDFIKTEVLNKLDISNYAWETHVSGLPQAGWLVSMTSRDMLKLGSLVLNDGKLNGEQFVPAEYIARATTGLVKPAEDWMPDSYRYGYFFYQSPLMVGEKSYNATFAWGGGDQRIIVVDELDLVVVFTGHDNEGTLMEQVTEVIVPAFVS